MCFGEKLTGIFKTSFDKSDMVKYGRDLFIISVAWKGEGRGSKGVVEWDETSAISFCRTYSLNVKWDVYSFVYVMKGKKRGE